MNWSVAQIASVVLCAMASGLAFSAMGHTPILGYMIAGIILGPSGLQLIQDRESIQIFAEMGILFLLFVIGVGLSFEKIKNIWRTSIFATLLSTLFIYVVIFISGCFLNLPHDIIVLVAFCITLSSTAVTVKSLNHLKEGDESIEQNTFGILIAQDLIALPMVVVIKLFGSAQAFSLNSTGLIAASVFVIALIFYFSKYHQYFYRFTDFIKAHNDTLTLTVFGFCLGLAVIAELSGLSAPFGAFIAGLILGNSTIKDEVKAIAFPIEEILLMTFFLSIGLLVNVKYIYQNIVLILAALVIVTIIKTIINIAVFRLCKFTLKDSFVISVLLGHIGEFSFMLASAAFKVKLIDDSGMQFLISVTALSLFLSPFWLIFAERCRALTNNVIVRSSWEFFRLAVGREIRKFRGIVDFFVSIVGKTRSAASNMHFRKKKIIKNNDTKKEEGPFE